MMVTKVKRISRMDVWLNPKHQTYEIDVQQHILK